MSLDQNDQKTSSVLLEKVKLWKIQKMKNNFKKFHKAFTLIELVVVIAFISIMSSIVLVSVSASKDEKAVEIEARKVAASIREAQNYALTGKQPTAEYPCRYGFRADSNNYYIDYYHAPVSCDILQNITQPYISYELENGVSFSFASGNFDFSIPWGTITPDEFSLPARYVISKGTSNYYTICVNSAGNVTELSGNVSCP